MDAGDPIRALRGTEPSCKARRHSRFPPPPRHLPIDVADVSPAAAVLHRQRHAQRGIGGKPEVHGEEVPGPGAQDRERGAGAGDGLHAGPDRTVASPPQANTTSAAPATAGQACRVPRSCGVVSDHRGAGQPAPANKLSMIR